MTLPVKVMDERFDSNGRGIVDGRRKRGAKLKWAPRRWKPLYDQMIILSVAGRNNKEIAEALDVTPVHVGNVLNCGQAKIILKALISKMRTEAISDITEIPTRLNASLDEASKRLLNYFKNDDVAKSAPGAMADRAMKLLTGLGHLKTGDPNKQSNKLNIKKAYFLGEEAYDRLSTAIEKSDRAQEVHKQIPVSVEGSYKDITDEEE